MSVLHNITIMWLASYSEGPYFDFRSWLQIIVGPTILNPIFHPNIETIVCVKHLRDSGDITSTSSYVQDRTINSRTEFYFCHVNVVQQF